MQHFTHIFLIQQLESAKTFADKEVDPLSEKVENHWPRNSTAFYMNA